MLLCFYFVILEAVIQEYFFLKKKQKLLYQKRIRNLRSIVKIETMEKKNYYGYKNR